MDGGTGVYGGKPRFRGDEGRGVARRNHHGRELTQQPLRGRYNLSKPVQPRSVGGPFGPARREGKMRVMAAAVMTAALAAATVPAATAARADDAQVERLGRPHPP